MNNRYTLQHSTNSKASALDIDTTALPRQWSIPLTLGHGKIEVERILSGVELWSIEGAFLPDTLFSSDDNRSVVSLGYLLEGSSETLCGDSHIKMKAGEQILFHGPNRCGEGRPRPNHPFHHVGMCCRPEKLAQLVGDDMAQAPQLHSMLSNRVTQETYHISTITPVMKLCLQQLLSCPYMGLSRRLYRESRVLELICHQFDHLLNHKKFTSTHESRALRSNEVEQVVHARELLMADLENPPGLLELASSVGMSHPKLSRCFKKVYGETPFAYLRKERLSQARYLLLNNGGNVTEVAYRVGYASLSHFAKAYRNQFGELPGAYAKY